MFYEEFLKFFDEIYYTAKNKTSFYQIDRFIHDKNPLSEKIYEQAVQNKTKSIKEYTRLEKTDTIKKLLEIDAEMSGYVIKYNKREAEKTAIKRGIKNPVEKEWIEAFKKVYSYTPHMFFSDKSISGKIDYSFHKTSDGYILMCNFKKETMLFESEKLKGRLTYYRIALIDKVKDKIIEKSGISVKNSVFFYLSTHITQLLKKEFLNRRFFNSETVNDIFYFLTDEEIVYLLKKDKSKRGKILFKLYNSVLKEFILKHEIDLNCAAVKIKGKNLKIKEGVYYLNMRNKPQKKANIFFLLHFFSHKNFNLFDFTEEKENIDFKVYIKNIKNSDYYFFSKIMPEAVKKITETGKKLFFKEKFFYESQFTFPFNSSNAILKYLLIQIYSLREEGPERGIFLDAPAAAAGYFLIRYRIKTFRDFVDYIDTLNFYSYEKLIEKSKSEKSFFNKMSKKEKLTAREILELKESKELKAMKKKSKKETENYLLNLIEKYESLFNDIDTAKNQS